MKRSGLLVSLATIAGIGTLAACGDGASAKKSPRVAAPVVVPPPPKVVPRLPKPRATRLVLWQA